MVMCPGTDEGDDIVEWRLFKEWNGALGGLLVACVGGNRFLKLGTAGRWEVEGVSFWLLVISQ